MGQLNHLDTTSFTVHGDYESASQTGEPGVIEVTHGHSKDHRPDLKQAVRIDMFIAKLSANMRNN